MCARGQLTGVRRADELGHVATALDDAVLRLDSLERARAADEQRRIELFSSIGHDLRSPLAVLRAAVEALEDGITPEPRRFLRSMARDVDALSALADAAAEALAPVAERRGVSIRVDAAPAGRRSWATPPRSVESSGTCSTTPSATARRDRPSTWSSSPTADQRCGCATADQASRTGWTTAPSSASHAPTRAGAGAPGAPASGWPSPRVGRRARRPDLDR
jgi:hypothetical protein